VTARLASLTSRAQIAVVAAALLLVVMIGYFALISPKRSDAAKLKKQTAAVQAQIDQNSSSAFKKALPAVRSASVFSLAKAMPTQLETPDVLLQLNQLALDSGISFDLIAPQSTSGDSAGTGSTDPFAVEPITVQFSGSFYNLLSLLQRLRNLVRVQNGNLFAVGRLYDVSDISFCSTSSQSCSGTTQGGNVPGQGGAQQAPAFGEIQANLTINAFVPQTPAATTTPGSTDTTSTSTTATTTTTTTTSNPTSAAPSTSGGTS
jgi:Tfp pilus assembly protein PilO